VETIIAAVSLLVGFIVWSIADGVLAGLKGLVSDAVKAACKKLAVLLESLFGQRWKIITLAGVGVMAVPLCGVALYFNLNPVAPEQARKIADLVRAAADRQASAMSQQECGELISAARGVAGINPRRFDQSASQALSQAHSCSERIRASDTKLATLIDASRGVADGGADLDSCSALAAAVAGLDSFDNDRLENSHKRAASTASTCRPIFQESDRRLAEISQLASAVNLGMTDLSRCEALVIAKNQLSQSDVQRLRAKSGSEFDKFTACTTRLQSSDNRIAVFSNAVDGFNPDDPDSAMSLTAARSALQGADIARLDPAKKDRMQSVSTRAAALLRDSDARLAALLASFREWQRNPTQANASTFDRSAQLADFDRKRAMSAEVRNAISALSISRQDLNAQIERWSLVERLTAAAERQSPADYFRPLSAAVGALTLRDKENATAKQNQSLERAISLIKSASPRNRLGEDFGSVPGPTRGAGQFSGPDGNSFPADNFATIPSKK
jgi:hypothetical protein